MKNMKKLLALALVLVMMSALSISVFAAASIYAGAYDPDGTNTDWAGTGPASITITLPTTQVAPSATTTYKIYKVFDATTTSTGSAISYSLVSGKTAVPNVSTFVADDFGTVYHFSGTYATETTTGAIPVIIGSVKKYIVPTSGELTEAEISAIAAYVGSSDLVCTALVPAGEASVTVTGLEYGYYYIESSTGSVVTVNSTKPNATVNDKNVIPPVVKSAGTQYDAASLQAIAAVGTSQSFTAVITKTHGAINLVFTDTMTNMTYNEDVVITVSAGTAPTSTQAVVATTATGFKVTFDNAYIAGLADGTTITLVYSGTITSDALSVNPAINKATLTSGDGNESNSDEVEVYNAKFTVTKKDGSGNPLSGAGFVIKNADGKYYKLNAETATAPMSITWYELQTNETLAQAIAAGSITEYTSDASGDVTAFTGLGAGTYTLVESTVPAGYNAVNDFSFTITDSDYTTTNLEQSTDIVNYAGTVLPSTGGIGTTLFYVIGAILVLGAGVVLVTKRRVRE